MDLDIYYSGPNAQQQYSVLAPAIKHAFGVTSRKAQQWEWDKQSNTLKRISPRLKILVTTAKDIDPSGTYAKQDWSDLSGCETKETVKAVEATTYLEDISPKFQSILRRAARQGFLPAKAFDNFTLTRPYEVADISVAVMKRAFTQSYAAAYAPDLQLGKSGTVFVTLPDEAVYPGSVVMQYSGYQKENLNFPVLDARDVATLTIGHEILGHAFHGHSVQAPKFDFTCAVLDYKALDRKTQGEAEADMAAAQFYRLAVNLKLVKQVDLPDYVAASRALGALYRNYNAFTVTRAKDVLYYLTSLKLDASKPDYDSGFTTKDVPGVNALPILINSVADALVGKAVAIQRSKEVAASPDKFTDVDKAVYEGDPRPIKEIAKIYAIFGVSARRGLIPDTGMSRFTADPAIHVASLLYMRETGVEQKMADRLLPQYRPVLSKLIGDYLLAYEKLGSDSLKSRVQDQLKSLRRIVGPEIADADHVMTFLSGIDANGKEAAADILKERDESRLTNSLPRYIFK